MNICPCCSHQLLCHIKANKIYWLCQNCRQEMPNFNSLKSQKTFKDSLEFSFRPKIKN